MQQPVSSQPMHSFILYEAARCVDVFVSVTKLTFSPGFPVGPFGPFPPRTPYKRTNSCLVSICTKNWENKSSGDLIVWLPSTSCELSVHNKTQCCFAYCRNMVSVQHTHIRTSLTPRTWRTSCTLHCKGQ